MQRVIGLDIGSYSIKVVEILNTLKSYEIVAFHEKLIPHTEDGPIETVAPQCMEQIFRENSLQADRIVTAMPGQFISSRVLTLGFSDPRKIQSAVFAEMEDAAPFNMDDMILDHQILGNYSGKTIVLAVMTRKAFLKNFLDLLQRIDIDPKLVDVDSLAFYNLSSYLPTEPGKCIGVVDIGHEKTSMCIVKDGVLQLFRSINLGGRYVTEFLARDLEISFPEAEQIKHSVSRVLCVEDRASSLTGDERMVVERMTLASNAIIKELGRTLYAFKSWDKEPLSHIYISGGTSKIKNIDKLIYDQLEVTTTHCRLDQSELKIHADLSEHMAIIPQSVAIGLRTVTSIKKHSQINLRRGEFAYVQNYESILKGLFSGLRVGAVVMVLLIFSYALKYFIYQKHITNLQDQYRRELLQTVEDKARFSKPMEFTRLEREAERYLSGQINEMKNGISIFKAQNSGGDALRLLKEISQAIPRDVKVDVTLYEFKTIEGQPGKITIQAETEGYATQASVIEALKKVSSLSEVSEKRSGIKPGSDGKVIEFTVQADYVPPGRKV